MATKKAQDELGERLEMRYVPLRTAVLWEKNPKQHDMGAIIQSIEQNGFVDPPKFDSALGAIVFGNGRTHALQLMVRNQQDRPRGIVEVDGEWHVPVIFGIDADSQAAAVRFAIDHNNLTLLGGNFGPNDLLRMYDENLYREALRGLADEDMLPITVDGEDLEALFAALPKEREEPVAPDQFASYGEDIAVEHQCPKCGYQWSGGKAA